MRDYRSTDPTADRSTAEDPEIGRQPVYATDATGRSIH
jgi:hypothetical protein